MSQLTKNTKKKYHRPRVWLFGFLFLAVGSWAANEIAQNIAQPEAATPAVSDSATPIPAIVDSTPKEANTTSNAETDTTEDLSISDVSENDLSETDEVEDIVIESNADEEDLEYLSVEEIMAEDETEELTTETTEVAEDDDSEFVNLDEILYGTTDEEEITRIKTEEGDIEPPTRKSLESEMQSLKQEVLAVNRDLFILEEDLLFPSGTQVNVFLSIDADHYFSLDGITLKINDRPISNHLYTSRELQALKRGAVQRLYTGNLPTGEHELVAVITGQGPEKRDFRRAVSIDFTKKTGTKYVELKIQGDTLRQQPLFQLKEWD